MAYKLVSIEKCRSHPGDTVVVVRDSNASPAGQAKPAAERTLIGRDSTWRAEDDAPVDACLKKFLNRSWSEYQSRQTVQEASEGSFPASDPPAWTLGRE